jgi:exodeoxyribonuclease VII large subunit
MTTENEKILSVSEYIDFLNSGLHEYRAKIVGEVSEAKIGPTGHVYFTLKDEKGGAIISCIIWRSTYHIFGIDLKEGIKITISGKPNIYPAFGKLSFITETIELSGEGALKKEYEKLKKKLTEEGLFAPERKRKLPPYPQKIGLITSKKGAVLGDFLSNIGNFGFKIKMIDSRVEGQEAVRDLLAALKIFKKQDIDLLAIIRGGGSKETLEVFNNELLVREVATFPFPVIVAIGHDKDVPLIDFAADVSVSTPSIVATEISRPWNELALLLERYEKGILSRYGEIFDNYKVIENKLLVALQDFKNKLANTKEHLGDYLTKIFSIFQNSFSKAKENLDYSEKTVLLNNPERQLKLGYSIASCGGKIIRKSRDVKIGDDLELRVSDGIINSKINKIKSN